MTVQKSERLLSLDVFRGITIAGMILVNNPGSWSTIYPPLKHAAWNGCTPTDLIFPFFLFIVGVAITYSLTKRKERGDDKQKLIINIVRRGVVLFLLGLFMAAFPFFKFETLRIPGVLQRIGVVYIAASVIFLYADKKTIIYILSGLLIFYWAVMSFIPVPGVGYPNLEPTTNFAAWLDNLLLGGHLWSSTKVWDPEGILSTIPAIGSTLLGIITGFWLRSNNDQINKTLKLFIWGNALMLAGYVWDGWFPLNKSLWTSSYVLYTGGLAMIFLAFCYWIIDVKGIKWWIKPFQVYGMNAITVFFLSGLMAKGLYLIKITNAAGEQVSLKTYLYTNLFLTWLPQINASLLWALTYIAIWLGLMWILYAKKIFIKV
jgi:predicted acyltransferase